MKALLIAHFFLTSPAYRIIRPGRLCRATKVAAASCQALLPEFNQPGAAPQVPVGAAAAAGAAGGVAGVAAGGVAAGWFCAQAGTQGKKFKATIRTIPIKARARFIPFSLVRPSAGTRRKTRGPSL